MNRDVHKAHKDSLRCQVLPNTGLSSAVNVRCKDEQQADTLRLTTAGHIKSVHFSSRLRCSRYNTHIPTFSYVKQLLKRNKPHVCSDTNSIILQTPWTLASYKQGKNQPPKAFRGSHFRTPLFQTLSLCITGAIICH